MLAYVYASALSGIEAQLVKVEVDVLSQGLPGWSMVGLLETAVKEARDRVGSAIRNAGYHIPNHKTIINLSPADIRKSGAHYDLAIAVGLLIASGVCRPAELASYLLAGELSLTGRVLPINGALLMAAAARAQGLRGMILPALNAWEAKLAGIDEVIAIESLADAVEFLNSGVVPKLPPPLRLSQIASTCIDYSDVKGQPFARRGMEIAAAGGHNVALKGPPGTGKTMLAERLPTILPPLAATEALEVARIMSWHGLLVNSSYLPSKRPFRAPHHSASYAGLIGGGVGGMARLGEISLAHNGVLFLDEMGEFRRDVIAVLRQPLEAGEVRIVRSGISITYPARFMLVAAFNPCPCGYFGHPSRPCICSMGQIRRYRSKLSGPLLDRIDLHIEVGPPPHEAIVEETPGETSSLMRARVLEARSRQEHRMGCAALCNANLTAGEIISTRLGAQEKLFLKSAARTAHLSARAVHRVLRVARTIADLAKSEKICADHIAEAMQFRPTLDDVG